MTDVIDDVTPDEPPSPDDEIVDAPPRRRTILLVSLAVAVVIAAFVGVLATREPSTDREAKSELEGKVAPAVAGKTLDGGSFNADNHLGRWVIVNFFATWCPPCIKEHPQLDAFEQEHTAAGDAVLVSVLYDDDPDDAIQFFKDRGGDWPVVLDDSGIATYYGVTGVPETYLIDPNGQVYKRLISGVTKSGLEAVMAQWEAEMAAGETGQ